MCLRMGYRYQENSNSLKNSIVNILLRGVPLSYYQIKISGSISLSLNKHNSKKNLVTMETGTNLNMLFTYNHERNGLENHT